MFTLLTRFVQRGNKINICVASSAVSRIVRFPFIAGVFKGYNFLELSQWYFSLQMFSKKYLEQSQSYLPQTSSNSSCHALIKEHQIHNFLFKNVQSAVFI